jgi:transposase-like protein
MANNLKTEKKVAVISMLCEGSSIRAIERITGVNQNTIKRAYGWSHREGKDDQGERFCHRSLQNQPVGVESKPATLRY